MYVLYLVIFVYIPSADLTSVQIIRVLKRLAGMFWSKEQNSTRTFKLILLQLGS